MVSTESIEPPWAKHNDEAGKAVSYLIETGLVTPDQIKASGKAQKVWLKNILRNVFASEFSDSRMVSAMSEIDLMDELDLAVMGVAMKIYSSGLGDD